MSTVLRVAYDGAGFHGFARQAPGPAEMQRQAPRTGSNAHQPGKDLPRVISTRPNPISSRPDTLRSSRRYQLRCGSRRSAFQASKAPAASSHMRGSGE